MSSSDQLKVITTTLSDYFDVLTEWLTSSANPLPSFEDYNELLTYDQILTEAVGGSDRAASFSTGAQADTVHQVIAINREFAMRGKNKAAYYTDAIVDSGVDSDYYLDLYGRYFNYYRGTSPDMSIG